MGFVKEFKEFALKGNLIDMAIAFVMGAAFSKVVSSFVERMFSPCVGLLMGGVDLTKKAFIIKDAVPEVKNTAGVVTSPGVAAVAIEWGAFLTACIDFVLVAFVMFMIIKGMNRMKKKEAEAPSTPPEPTMQEKLLMEIRDSLKK